MKYCCELLSKICNRRGQSIVEITLITPLILAALYIPADFGIAFYVGNILNSAVRDGVVIGSASGKSGVTTQGGEVTDRSFNSTDAVIVKDKVVARLPSYITSRSVVIRFYESATGNCLEFIEVTASGNYSYTFYKLLRLFGGTVNSSATLSRTAQMPYRNQPYDNGTKCTVPTTFTYTNV